MLCNQGHDDHGDGTGGTQTGVAPGAVLIPCKVFSSSGGGATLGNVYDAGEYLVENGARVITMSMGVSGTNLPVYLLRTDRLFYNNMRAAGVLMFNSAGNEHNSLDPPWEIGMTGRVPPPWNALDVPFSSTSGVVTVGGTGYMNNGVYIDSSRGPVTWEYVSPWLDWPWDETDDDPPGLIKPDISAPGARVNSTIRSGGYSGDSWYGTSMSCPHIAGVAALMLEKNPTLSPAGMDSIIEQTALDLYFEGKDNVFGAGLVNAYDAVQATPNTQSTPVLDEMPVKMHLAQNHPNPFNPQTSIKYNITREGHVELAVYDLTGRLVKTLVSGTSAVGEFTATWDGTNLSGARVPSGTYLYRLSAGVDTQTRKMSLVK